MSTLPKSQHGNSKFPFHRLSEIGKKFALENDRQRHTIFKSMKNYNNKHGTGIHICTKKMKDKVYVIRIEKKK